MHASHRHKDTLMPHLRSPIVTTHIQGLHAGFDLECRGGKKEILSESLNNLVVHAVLVLFATTSIQLS